MSGLVFQALRFGLVGVAATLTHYIVALGISALHVPILWANAVGFVVAFCISFFGHRHYTFANRNIRAGASFRRFAMIAIGGFFLSEGLLATLLKLTTLSETAALTLALATTAGLSFLISRHWVFNAGAQSVGPSVYKS
tara:strand:+ start:4594 stop:5010 length:417 start_codon:yes stop_codon:yes gene_type:complete